MSVSIKALALIGVLALLATAARSDGIGAFDNGQGVFGRLGSFGQGVVAPPPTCSPGGPTGQMDFSVCSNIAITAAIL